MVKSNQNLPYKLHIQQNILESKLLKSLSTEEKLELATRALCGVTKEIVSIHRHEEKILDRVEAILESIEKLFTKISIRRWQDTINMALEERKHKHGPSK